jgi:pimeloyl-ACP methyl ester carboxylesterase
MTPSGYSPASLADDLRGLLDHLGIRSAHLAAHSFGGVIAMQFALKQPHRVRSLVLADTHIAAVRHVADAREWAQGEVVQATLDAHGLDLNARDPYFGYKLLTRVARMNLASVETPPALLELVSPLTANAGNRTASEWLRLMESTTAQEELMSDDGLSLASLRTFEFPIMAMYGDRSPAKLTGTELLQVWQHAVFRSIRNAGHFFPSSRVQEVISNMRRFWGKDPRRLQPRARAGELPCSYFRSDRIFEGERGWYLRLREAPNAGPFPTFEATESFLHNFFMNKVSGTA